MSVVNYLGEVEGIEEGLLRGDCSIEVDGRGSM
jgi:hypothetical protein